MIFERTMIFLMKLRYPVFYLLQDGHVKYPMFYLLRDGYIHKSAKLELGNSMDHGGSPTVLVDGQVSKCMAATVKTGQRVATVAL